MSDLFFALVLLRSMTTIRAARRTWRFRAAAHAQLTGDAS